VVDHEDDDAFAAVGAAVEPCKIFDLVCGNDVETD